MLKTSRSTKDYSKIQQGSEFDQNHVEDEPIIDLISWKRKLAQKLLLSLIFIIFILIPLLYGYFTFLKDFISSLIFSGASSFPSNAPSLPSEIFTKKVDGHSNDLTHDPTLYPSLDLTPNPSWNPTFVHHDYNSNSDIRTLQDKMNEARAKFENILPGSFDPTETSKNRLVDLNEEMLPIKLDVERSEVLDNKHSSHPTVFYTPSISPSFLNDPTFHPSLETTLDPSRKSTLEPDSIILPTHTPSQALDSTFSSVNSPHQCPENIPSIEFGKDQNVHISEQSLSFAQKVPQDECHNLKYNRYKNMTDKDRFFEPQEYNAKVLHLDVETIKFCDKSLGIYNPSLLCINSQLCDSDLPIYHAFQNITRDTEIFAIGIARSFSMVCEDWPDQREGRESAGQNLFFINTRFEISGYTFIIMDDRKMYDCRLFVANSEVLANCASGSGGKFVKFGYDSDGFHIDGEFKMRGSRHNHWNERNILPLPCGQDLFWRFYPEEIAKWTTLPEEWSTREEDDGSRFNIMSVPDGLTQSYKESLVDDWKHWHNSAGFLRTPLFPGMLVGLLHSHKRSGGAVLKYGHSYLHRFVVLESTKPYQTRFLGKPFCFQVKDQEDEVCDAIQIPMSLTQMNDGKIIIAFGKNDCESMVAVIEWKDIQELFLDLLVEVNS